MKTTKYIAIVVTILLLSIATVFASPPGKGEITVNSDDAIDRIIVRYNISSLMGEPIINVVYSYYSYTLLNQDFDPSTVLWLKIKDNIISTNYAWIRIDAIPPFINGPWSDDFTGSPSWDTVLVSEWSGKQSIKYVDAGMAKQFWRNGFQVVGAQFSKKYNKPVSQKPQPVQQPQQPKPQPQPPVQKPAGATSPFVGDWQGKKATDQHTVAFIYSEWFTVKQTDGMLSVHYLDMRNQIFTISDIRADYNRLSYRVEHKRTDPWSGRTSYNDYTITLTRTADPNVLDGVIDSNDSSFSQRIIVNRG